jgi:hypothetical protein
MIVDYRIVAVAFALTCLGGSTVGESSQAGKPPAEDLCSFLTEAEAEAILKTPLNAPSRQSSGDCWYGSGGPGVPGDIILSILPVTMRTEQEFDQFLAKEVATINARMKKALPDWPETKISPVPGLNVPARQTSGGVGALYVLKGTRVLVIHTAVDANAVAVATKALPRMK